jgi:hypothetical protein
MIPESQELGPPQSWDDYRSSIKFMSEHKMVPEKRQGRNK